MVQAWDLLFAGFSVNTQYASTGCATTMGNGINELIETTNLPTGITGQTNCSFGCNPARINECDVLIKTTSNWNDPDERQPASNGLTATIHEIGHFFGLNHTDDIDVMRTATPVPVMGGPWVQPFGDDAAGVRSIYGGTTSRTNVFATSTKLSGGQVVAADSGFFNICRGQQTTITFTVGNNGTTMVSSALLTFTLSTSPDGSNGVTVLNLFATNPADSYFTSTSTFTVPANLPLGQYQIFWQADSNNQFLEYNEEDNKVHSFKTLNVNC